MTLGVKFNGYVLSSIVKTGKIFQRDESRLEYYASGIWKFWKHFRGGYYGNKAY